MHKLKKKRQRSEREKRKNMTCAAEHQILSAIIIIGVCIDRTWVSYESYIVASDKDNRNKILFRALAPRPKKLIASLVYICNHVESSQRGGKGVAERNQSKRVRVYTDLHLANILSCLPCSLLHA